MHLIIKKIKSEDKLLFYPNIRRKASKILVQYQKVIALHSVQ